MARLFVALPVPDHVRLLAHAAAAPAADLAPELTWTRPEGWHVTLAFVGEVPDEQATAVRDAVAAAVDGSGPIELALDAAGRFGSRVLWVGVRDDPAGAVRTLGWRVQRRMAEAGLDVQRRPVHPHLTLARGSRGRREVDDAVVAAVAPVTARWEVDAVELVRSIRGRGPARYEPVASWPLVAGTP